MFTYLYVSQGVGLVCWWGGGGTEGVHKIKPFCLYIFVLLMQCLRVDVFAPVFSLCLCMTGG